MTDNGDCIRLVEERHQPEYDDVQSGRIYCLDLNNFSPAEAQDWIDRMQSVYSQRSLGIRPSIVVMGTPKQLEEYGAAFVEAGAALWEKPSEFYLHNQKEIVEMLEREYLDEYEESASEQGRRFPGQQHRDWIMEEYPAETIEERESGKMTEADKRHGGRGGASSIYVNPPLKIGMKDFKQLMNRMRMSDGDPTKDD